MWETLIALLRSWQSLKLEHRKQLEKKISFNSCLWPFDPEIGEIRVEMSYEF